MASTSTDKSGNVTIHVKGTDGKRRPIRPGKLTGRKLDTIKSHIDELEQAALNGLEPSMGTRAWLDGVGDTLRDKLARAGLCAPREAATLGAFIDRFIDSRSDVKPSTLLTYQRMRNHAVEYFGDDANMRSITPADAVAWSRWLTGERGLAKNTARKSASMVKQVMAHAVKARVLDTDPFSDLTGTVTGNADRYAFIDRETIRRVLDACPDGQWRLLVVLARYGGLRIPSEALALTWGDIHWGTDDEPGTLLIHSPKTEHHEGKATRTIPMFPELRPHLEAAFDEAEEGETHIITRYREATQNLRTQFQRIIHKAGVEPWPRLWQNLRSSRATELADAYPIQAATAWLGHSPQVAERHYLQVTDEHMRRAVTETAPEKVVREVVRHPVRRGALRGGRAEPKTPPSVTEGHRGALGVCSMGLAGLEPATSPLSGVRSSQLSYKPGMSRGPVQGGGGPRVESLGRVGRVGQAGWGRYSQVAAGSWGCLVLPYSSTYSSNGRVGGCDMADGANLFAEEVAMKAAELAEQVQRSRCRVVGWEEAKHDEHRRVLGALAFAFDEEGVTLLCEPSLARGRYHPPDLVLIHPELGVHVIELKAVSLDQIERVEAGGMCEFQYRGGLRKKNPEGQAFNAMFAIKDATQAVLERDARVPFHAWVAFSQIEREAWVKRWGEDAWMPSHVLFQGDLELERLAESLTDVGRRAVLAKGVERCPAEDLRAVMRAFGDTAVLMGEPGEREPRKVRAGTLGERFDEAAEAYKMLTPEQHDLSKLDWSGGVGPRLVRGVAGSGKTIVLANHVARRLAHAQRQATLLDPDPPMPRLAVVCHNRTLVPLLRKKVADAFAQRTGRAMPEGGGDGDAPARAALPPGGAGAVASSAVQQGRHGPADERIPRGPASPTRGTARRHRGDALRRDLRRRGAGFRRGGVSAAGVAVSRRGCRRQIT